ncbi:MAG TPA: hypothetical protein VI524_05695 [Anaerolineales bacterium]|nr:hypothetical protein [Anaerolineales bacterium]
MHVNRKILLALFVLLLAGCRWYDQGGPVTSTNGLSCQGYTNYEFFQWRDEGYRYYIREQGAECSYECPDGTVSQAEISSKFSTASPLYSASKEELDAQFCGAVSQPAATQTPVPATISPTHPVSPTAEPSATITVQASATAGTSATAEPPLLTGRITMCDTGAQLISFRIVQPPPDLTGRRLEVRISDQQTVCTINPTNPSLLTCTIPASVLFPARVVVNVDDTVVNDFIYDGLGCAKITTPVATTTP